MEDKDEDVDADADWAAGPDPNPDRSRDEEGARRGIVVQAAARPAGLPEEWRTEGE